MNATQIIDYVRKNGRLVNVYSEGGDAENGPELSHDDQYVKLGNLQLREDASKGWIDLRAVNRRLKRTASAFVLNEPERSGAEVVVFSNVPDYPF